MSQAGRIQFAPDDIIRPVRSHASGLPGVRDATKPSSFSEKHIPTIFDAERGSDYKTTGPDDRDIRKRQVKFHRRRMLQCSQADILSRSLEGGFCSGMIIVGEFEIDLAATDICRLAYQSVGVIYGDIGTSPLYVYSSTFSDNPSYDDLLGALSLIIWTITLMVSVKYVFIVLNADDEGEGGTFALYSLLSRFVSLLVKSLVEGAADLRLKRPISFSVIRKRRP